LTALPVAAALSVTPAMASSPVFGGAKATVLTTAQAKSVTGKGYYSQYYGYLGNLYANYAAYYGAISAFYDGAGYSSSYTYWYTASSYAYNAYVYYYYAYSYKVNGNQ